MPQKTKKRSRRTKGGQELIASMREIAVVLESGRPIEQTLTVRTVEVSEPAVYDARKVRQLRAKVGVSQAVFAKMLGVSAVLVQHWEQGLATPRPIARRLLDEISLDPLTFATRSMRRVRASA